MRVRIVLAVVLASVINAIGQVKDENRGEVLEYNISSPYHTIKTHLEYLQTDFFYPKVAAKVFHPDVLDGRDGQDLAIKLKQILDGHGLLVDLDELPRERNYFDSVSRRHRYVLFEKYPEIYLERIEGKWFYSRKTVNSIESLHAGLYRFGTDKLLNLLPKIGHKKYFGLHTWQHLGVLITLTFCFVFHKLFTWLFEMLIINVLLRFGYQKLAHEVVVPIARPLSYLVIFPILILMVPVLQLPIGMNRYVILTLRAVWPVFAIVFFYRLVDILAMYLEKLALKTENTLDDQLVPLVRKVLKTFVVVIGALFILNNLDLNITGIIAGLSIGGLAFALAAQDTLKNFFGSLMIFIDRPFQVGDWITCGDVDGIVEEVGFRATRVRTFRNSLMYVPNAQLTDRMVDNHGLRTLRRFNTTLSVTYDTPSHVMEVFIQGIRAILERHPDTRKDNYHVYFNDFAASSLDIMFVVHLAVSTRPDELRVRQEILLDIVKLASELGVNFAFPTQTLHVETFPGQLANNPSYEGDRDILKHKLNKWLADTANPENNLNPPTS
jgi:MscS family membrane protein